MEVGRLPLSASQRGKLISAGYTTLASLSRLSPSHLARDLKVPEAEAYEILRVASLGSGLEQPDKHSALVNGGQTAWEILNEEKLSPRITTSCADLDYILGGGINCKEVTEIGGVPGIGKTQLGTQLAVNVQRPIGYGGLGGKAVYIDTEGSFMVERALQIAEASVVNMSCNSELTRKESEASQVERHPTDILEKIYYFRICTSTEQIALINYLDQFISEHKDVVDEPWEKVVIFNQVTTKCTEGSFQLSLALGDSWSHSCTNRIILYWNGDERNAYIDK
ncbi:hypothetical protein ACLB2K_072296 [Fragaria x ananassa]